VQALGELLLEGRFRDVTERDDLPPRSALRRRDLIADERLSDVEAPVEQLYVLPAEPEQLATP